MLRSPAPYVLLYGQENEFNLSLSTALEKSGLWVNICKNRQNFTEQNIPHKTHEYAVYPVYETVHFEEVKELVADNLKTKSLLILPYSVPKHHKEKFALFVSDIKKILPSIGILYCSSPLYLDQSSPPYPLTSQSGVIELPSEESMISFIDGEKLTNQILRNLFSLRAYGHQQSIIGSIYSSHELSTLLFSEGILNIFSSSSFEFFSNDVEPTTIPVDSSTLVSFFHSWYRPIPSEPPLVEELQIEVQEEESSPSHPLDPPIINTPKATKKKRNKKKVGWIIFTGFGFLILPYVISLCLLLACSLAFATGTTRLSRPLYDAIHGTSYIGASISRIYLQNGIFERVYGDSLTMNTIVQRVASSNLEFREATRDTLLSLQKLVNGESLSGYDFKGISQKYDTYYSEMGFVLADYESLSFTKALVNQILPTKIVSDTRAQALSYSSLTQKAPELFGLHERKTYALFLQDEATLRPTGGKLSAVALLTFENGRIIDQEVLDTKDVSSQFSGVVEAPEPIRRYLTDNWKIEDANWDYSFDETSKQLMWFIEKELDRKVSGVVSVSMSYAKTVTKGEGESGSALLSNAIDSFFDNPESLEMAFETKNLMAYSTDSETQEALTALSWANVFTKRDCSGNCMNDQMGVYESNFGEPNMKIKREAQLLVSLEESSVKHTLRYLLKNESDIPYKTFVRVVTADDVGFSPVAQTELLTFGKNGLKDGGVYKEVEPQETVEILFSWEAGSLIDLEKEGLFHLHIYSQPGVSPYPLSIEVIDRSEKVAFQTPSLTKGHSVYYNTVLSRDFATAISWK